MAINMKVRFGDDRPSSLASGKPSPPDIPVHYEMKRYTTQKIEGRISIAERGVTMPVSMGVAEFEKLPDGSWGRMKASEVKALDPSKPVWVVVHGMNSWETEVKINELTKALSQYAEKSDFQIVSVNWSEAAKDVSMSGMDVVWTTAVGKWLGQRLLAAGFAPEQISGLGHSHGSYVLEAMGRELIQERSGRQMNSLIALDPAGNVPLWTGFDHAKVNFAEVSQRSVSFEIALVADSNALAATADISFKVDSPSTIRPSVEHGLGMTTITSILNHEFATPSLFSQYLGFDKLSALSDADIRMYNHDQYDGKAEGEVTVDVEWIQKDGQSYPMTMPLELRFKKAGSANKTIIRFNALLA